MNRPEKGVRVQHVTESGKKGQARNFALWNMRPAIEILALL
jgi:hypothetical protein